MGQSIQKNFFLSESLVCTAFPNIHRVTAEALYDYPHIWSRHRETIFKNGSDLNKYIFDSHKINKSIDIWQNEKEYVNFSAGA